MAHLVVLSNGTEIPVRLSAAATKKLGMTAIVDAARQTRAYKRATENTDVIVSAVYTNGQLEVGICLVA